MTIYRKEHEVDGWSRWIQPVMDRPYRMMCCDCGLVHDIEFEALRKGKDNPDGSWQATPLNRDKYRIQLRARRNARATAATRRQRRR